MKLTIIMHKNSGTLFIVATPIGNLQDITLRAIEVLQSVDLIACEDTRTSKVLLVHYGIQKQTISLHQYNEEERITLLIAKLQDGKNIALISDAGTPLISDPGYRLVTSVLQKDIKVVPIPGACAAIAALSAAGLPTDKFSFEGFLPVKHNERKNRLLALKSEMRTLIFHEAPRRILETLKDMSEIFGEKRKAVLARELTKMFETIHSANLCDLLAFVTADSNQQKGEMVIIVHGAEEEIATDKIVIDQENLLRILSSELSSSQAASLASKIIGKKAKKKDLYRMIISN